MNTVCGGGCRNGVCAVCTGQEGLVEGVDDGSGGAEDGGDRAVTACAPCAAESRLRRGASTQRLPARNSIPRIGCWTPARKNRHKTGPSPKSTVRRSSPHAVCRGSGSDGVSAVAYSDLA